MERDPRSDQEKDAAAQSGSGDAGTRPLDSNGSGPFSTVGTLGLPLPPMEGPAPVRSALAGILADAPRVWERLTSPENTMLANPKARARLNRELTQLTQAPPEGCKVKIVGENMFEWEVTIAGPRNTPYEGGVFKLRVYFPLSYPFMPPLACFQTKIYHCNVGAEGKIYLDSLCENWTPVLTVANILVSITQLLVAPNPEEPLDPNIAHLYVLHRELHDNRARIWTVRYAKGDDAAET